ncbi:MAG: hypothetical protein NZ903_00940, partial [Candidatus Micrarchaeota archaeon]|nr:hypothetical protein [Candidatus Micrarchaeota archaeon]
IILLSFNSLSPFVKAHELRLNRSLVTVKYINPDFVIYWMFERPAKDSGLFPEEFANPICLSKAVGLKSIPYFLNLLSVYNLLNPLSVFNLAKRKNKEIFLYLSKQFNFSFSSSPSDNQMNLHAYCVII